MLCHVYVCMCISIYVHLHSNSRLPPTHPTATQSQPRLHSFTCWAARYKGDSATLSMPGTRALLKRFTINLCTVNLMGRGLFPSSSTSLRFRRSTSYQEMWMKTMNTHCMHKCACISLHNDVYVISYSSALNIVLNTGSEAGLGCVHNVFSDCMNCYVMYAYGCAYLYMYIYIAIRDWYVSIFISCA